jgi:hypothetical protein
MGSTIRSRRSHGWREPSRTLENIERVEIENDFAFSFRDNLGIRVILEGTLSMIRELKGFHRQVSTPMQIHVTKMLLAAGDRRLRKKIIDMENILF